MLVFYISCIKCFSFANVQVFSGAWTAVLVSLDNPGAWNLRSQNLDRWYLGQETYLRIVNPEENGETEFSVPDNVLYCGALAYMQKYANNAINSFSPSLSLDECFHSNFSFFGIFREQKHSSATPISGGNIKLFSLLMAFFALVLYFQMMNLLVAVERSYGSKQRQHFPAELLGGSNTYLRVQVCKSSQSWYIFFFRGFSDICFFF